MKEINRATPVVLTRQDLASIRNHASVLSCETRVSILLHLLDGELGCQALCDAVGKSRSAINSPIALLKSAGYVQTRRSGQSVLYSIADRYRGLISVCRDRAPAGKPR